MLTRCIFVILLVTLTAGCVGDSSGPSSGGPQCEPSTSSFPNFGCFDIAGEVRDSANTLLPGAYIYIGGSSCCSALLPVTDAKGAYHLRGYIMQSTYPLNTDILLKVYSEYPAQCPPCNGLAAEDSTTVTVRAVAPGQIASVHTANIRYSKAIPGL